MITAIEISEALAVCEAASKGPAVWACDPNDTVQSALQRFVDHHAKAKAVTGSNALHQVDLPDERTESDGTALCFAVTGNGPHGAENARFIAGALDPRLGWAAMLKEVVDLTSASYKLESTIMEAIAAIESVTPEEAIVDAHLMVEHIERILRARDNNALLDRRGEYEAAIEGATLELSEIDAVLDPLRAKNGAEVVSGDGETSRPMSRAEFIKAIIEEKVDEQTLEERDFRCEQIEAIADALGDETEWSNLNDRGVNAIRMAEAMVAEHATMKAELTDAGQAQHTLNEICEQLGLEDDSLTTLREAIAGLLKIQNDWINAKVDAEVARG